MDKEIFRKVSIDRLASPEQLDRMITVTSARSWLIIIAVGCMLAAVVIWSITGSLATNIEANGMLVKSGGIVDISSSETGQISDIRVKPGDYVKKGDIVARLNQAEIVAAITDLSDKLELMKESQTGQPDRLALTGRIAELKKKLRSSSLVTSQEEGRVIEVNLHVGEMVAPGSVVMSIVRESASVRNLVAVMYVPVESGKKLAPGMAVRIAPSTVNKEEFGYILGRIVSVSEYPVTVRTARQKLGNSELAAAYVGSTPCLEILADLVIDKKNQSGYRWSTLSGPPNKIENGTVCSASVIVARQRPIELVFPRISDLLGSGQR